MARSSCVVERPGRTGQGESSAKPARPSSAEPTGLARETSGGSAAPRERQRSEARASHGERAQAGDDGDENADDQRDDDRPCCSSRPLLGSVNNLVEEPEEAFREAQAEQDADDRGEQADDERLDQHGPHDLAPGRADRAQRRELAGPLRNGDRQRVRDHERADEQRDAAEGEQEALEEAEEALRLARILVGLTFSGAYLGAGRQDGLNRRDELRLGRALGRSGTDLIELKVLVEQLLRGGQVERGQRRPDVALGGEVEEPDTQVAA